MCVSHGQFANLQTHPQPQFPSAEKYDAWQIFVHDLFNSSHRVSGRRYEGSVCFTVSPLCFSRHGSSGDCWPRNTVCRGMQKTEKGLKKEELAKVWQSKQARKLWFRICTLHPMLLVKTCNFCVYRIKTDGRVLFMGMEHVYYTFYIIAKTAPTENKAIIMTREYGLKTRPRLHISKENNKTEKMTTIFF